MFAIQQLNNTYDLGEEDLKSLDKISVANHSIFGGCLNMEEHIAYHRFAFTGKNYHRQLFYISDESLDVVSSLEIISRVGNHPNTISLIVSSAFTNPNYRKQGHFGTLLKWAIDYYETGHTDCGSDYSLGKSITDPYCQEYLDLAVPVEMRENDRVHWTLHSIVGEYYKRFGFLPCRNMTWLTTDAESVPNLSSFEHFELNAENETFLTQKDFEKYYFGSKYRFEESKDENSRNLAQEDSQIVPIWKGLDNYIENENKIVNKQVFENCGLRIMEGDEETLVLLSPFFISGRIVVQRIFTNVTDKTVLKRHWERISNFIFSFAQTYWKTLPCLENAEIASKRFVMADVDFICASNVVSKSEWIDLVTASNGWADRGPDIMLPMVRSWKEEHKDMTLAYNGFIGFM